MTDDKPADGPVVEQRVDPAKAPAAPTNEKMHRGDAALDTRAPWSPPQADAGVPLPVVEAPHAQREAAAETQRTVTGVVPQELGDVIGRRAQRDPRFGGGGGEGDPIDRRRRPPGVDDGGASSRLFSWGTRGGPKLAGPRLPALDDGFIWLRSRLRRR